MRSSLLLAASLGGLAAAMPKAMPQKIDFDEIAALPEIEKLGPAPGVSKETNLYNPEEAAANTAAEIPSDPIDKRSLSRRGVVVLDRNDPCGPQPDGYGPKPPVDTAEAFLAWQPFKDTAHSSAAPGGYVPVFFDKQASIESIGYLGVYTLQNYSPDECATKCAAAYGCLSFNLFFERSPTINPADACPNPAGMTDIRCTLYGFPIAESQATNTGQWRGPRDSTGEAFHVVIAGSNGYTSTRTPPSIPGYVGPANLGRKAIEAPNDPVTNKDTYMGVKTFNDGPFDPARCAAACDAQTQFNAEHPRDGVSQVCRFFNAYTLLRNNVPVAMYCSFYDREWAASYATNEGQWRDGDHYTIYSSVSYTVGSPP